MPDPSALHLGHSVNVSLATGLGFRVIESALRDPAQHCARILDFPRGTRQLEPMERWQTRAVMAALGSPWEPDRA
jgi:hypothetical protein